MPFDGNWVLIDLLIEALAQGNDVFGSIRAWGVLEIRAVEPEPHMIKKMEPRPVEDLAAFLLFVGAEENASRKDALAALNDTAVVEAVFGELKEVEQLGGAIKVNYAAFLLYRQGCSPERDEAVLTEGQTEAGMRNDF